MDDGTKIILAETAGQDFRTREATTPEPLLDAEVTAGEGTAEQKSWRLARPVTLIGFSRHAHIRVEGAGVEAVHAALLNTGDAIVLANLVSRQGVYCGSMKVDRRRMGSGESFRLGECLLRVEAERTAGSPALDDPRMLEMPWRVHLKVVRGEPRAWTVDALATVIGRRPGCPVRLESKEVLPLHALLTRVGSQIVLASLAADRSIRVNGEHVHMAALASGDVLTIWPLQVQFTIGERTAAATESADFAE